MDEITKQMELAARSLDKLKAQKAPTLREPRKWPYENAEEYFQAIRKDLEEDPEIFKGPWPEKPLKAPTKS